MFKTNEYFDGKVKSIAFNTNECPATVGVMAVGEYEFGTNCVEFMTVTSGKLIIQQPGESNWTEYTSNQTFRVEANVKFKVKVPVDTSYICLYK